MLEKRVFLFLFFCKGPAVVPGVLAWILVVSVQRRCFMAAMPTTSKSIPRVPPPVTRYLACSGLDPQPHILRPRPSLIPSLPDHIGRGSNFSLLRSPSTRLVSALCSDLTPSFDLASFLASFSTYPRPKFSTEQEHMVMFPSTKMMSSCALD